MKVLETERLTLRWLIADDAVFILDLLNQPSFLKFIGDKGVRTLDDARGYINDGPMKMYRDRGHGLYAMELKGNPTTIGICGLIKRDGLDDPDIGFAVLPEYWRRGYTFEAAAAVLEHGRETLGIERIVAITSPKNVASIQLLEKLGMHREGTIRFKDDDEILPLFATP